MNSWVLIIAFFSPSGEWMSKVAEGPIKTEAECRARELTINTTPQSPKVMMFRGFCVTHDHWTGKKPMPDVALD